jgi:hypothetical protein
MPTPSCVDDRYLWWSFGNLPRCQKTLCSEVARFTGQQRNPALPDIPTLQEAGVAAFESSTWFAIVAPPKTPSDIIQYLNQQITEVLMLPEVKEQFVKIGRTGRRKRPWDDEIPCRWARKMARRYHERACRGRIILETPPRYWARSSFNRGRRPWGNGWADLNASRDIISAVYLKDAADPQWKNDDAIKEFRAFMSKYYSDGDQENGTTIFGYGSAKALAQVLRQCGENLTRDNIVGQMTSMSTCRASA